MTNTCHINIDDFKTLSPLVRDTIKNIINDNETYINNNRFTEFYNRQGNLPHFEIGVLTSILYAANINPLLHMQEIPPYFLYDSNISGDFIIPNNVTSIGHDAFSGCVGLTSVTIGNDVIGIGYEAFTNCTGLRDIIIPDSVTSIGAHAFEDCTGLTSVTIGNGVTGIGYEAFTNCKGLTSITFTGTKAQWHIISKGSDWNYKTGSYTIHCTDGDIRK